MTRAPTQQRPTQPANHGNGAAPSGPTEEQKNATLLNEILGKSTEYTPLAEREPIKLSLVMVRQYLCVPTKSGKMPPDSEIIKFITMCKQRALNPWAGDCYLLGYDTNSGPKFSIVVAIQAFFKRAEINAQFDGIESGVVVMVGDEVIERQGDLTLPGEVLLGGWARVYRKDRSRPFYQRLKLSTFKKGTPIWQGDPEGMISKCAEMGSLRQAFPSEVGGLYLQEELIDLARAVEEEKKKHGGDASAAQALKDRLMPTIPAKPEAPVETVVGKAPAPAEVVQTRPDDPGEHNQDPPVVSSGREPGADDPEPEISEATNSPEAVESPEVQFGR